MICSIHQPNYIPYIWLFHKINASDIFVFYDNAQYTKWDYHNRNKIKTSNWEVLLTIPVNVQLWDKINQVKINNKILKKHLKTIEQAYKKSAYFNEIYQIVQDLYSYDWNSLAEFNINIIKKISEYLEINTKFIVLSEIIPELESNSTDALVKVCKAAQSNEYISGSGWKNYVEEEKFSQNNIKLKFQEFAHPKYEQIWGDFIPYMSILDLLFNEWKNSKNFIK